MRLDLTLANRQRVRPVDLGSLRRIVGGLFRELPEISQAEFGVSLVAGREMIRLNKTYLQHAGPTDVITFDYGEDRSARPRGTRSVHGEIIICVEEAVRQARGFQTTWQSEVVRYLVHGVLHLLGHDDQSATKRRRMKRAEDRLLGLLAERFALSRLARKPRLRT